MKKLLSFTIVLTLFATKSLAQLDEVGGGIGNVTYIGDLSPSFIPSSFDPTLTLFFKRNSEDYSKGIRAQFSYMKIRGSNSGESRFSGNSASFTNTSFELSILGEYNFLDFNKKLSNSNRRVFFSPYVYGGIGGLFTMSSTSSFTTTTTLNNITPVIPIGVGIKFLLSPFFVVSSEIAVRKMFTDNLDGLSMDEQIASSTGTDLYYTTSITLSYVFRGINCPINLRPRKSNRNALRESIFKK